MNAGKRLHRRVMRECLAPATMLSHAHILGLAASFVPYGSLGLYDAWLHGSARHVPRLEKFLHGAVGLSLTGLWMGLLAGRRWEVIIALGIFAIAGIWDELGYHGRLAPRERRIHQVAYGCFFGFLLVVWTTGALP